MPEYLGQAWKASSARSRELHNPARGLRSPDIADALALTFAQPVGRRVDVFIPGERKEWNPWDKLKMLDARR